ncbi:unnamed protein product [Calypogeia fissa]
MRENARVSVTLLVRLRRRECARVTEIAAGMARAAANMGGVAPAEITAPVRAGVAAEAGPLKILPPLAPDNIWHTWTVGYGDADSPTLSLSIVRLNLLDCGISCTRRNGAFKIS